MTIHLDIPWGPGDAPGGRPPRAFSRLDGVVLARRRTAAGVTLRVAFPDIEVDVEVGWWDALPFRFDVGSILAVAVHSGAMTLADIRRPRTRQD